MSEENTKKNFKKKAEELKRTVAMNALAILEIVDFIDQEVEA
jgi:hypothetical protein